MSEIEKYYNGEIEVDYEEERDSITWWTNRFNAVERDNRELRKEIERLHSIIKEVREYIEEWQRFPHTNGSTHKELKNLIDILDKENK